MRNSTVIASIVLAVGIMLSAFIISSALDNFARKIESSNLSPSPSLTTVQPTIVRSVAAAASTQPSWDSLLAADVLIESDDFVEVTIADLLKPGELTTRTCRVGKDGNIRLWYVGDIAVVGQNTGKIEESIAAAYEKKQILSHPTVWVTPRRAGR